MAAQLLRGRCHRPLAVPCNCLERNPSPKFTLPCGVTEDESPALPPVWGCPGVCLTFRTAHGVQSHPLDLPSPAPSPPLSFYILLVPVADTLFRICASIFLGVIALEFPFFVKQLKATSSVSGSITD